jgi:RND family efflux transporter MFP subunit
MNTTHDPNAQHMDVAADLARDNLHRPHQAGVWAVVIAIAIAMFVVGFIVRPLIGPGSNPVAGTQPAKRQLWTCSMHPQVIREGPGECPICHMQLTPMNDSRGASGDLAVTIDPVVEQNMGVRTTTIGKGKLLQRLRAVGYIEEPEPLHRDINLRVNGWIEKLYANIDGMAIEKDRPFFDLYSPELTVAIDELIAARKQLDRGAGDANATALMDSSRRKLLQYGLQPSQLDALAKLDIAPTTIPILAPLGGHLTQKLVNDGAAVKSGDLVLRIAARDRMWVDAQIYEQQIPLVHDGQTAFVTTSSLPGKRIEGRVMFIHPHLDPQTRTAMARIEIPNEGMHLRQGMFASVELMTDAGEALLIPREAVIDTGVRQIALVAAGGGRFEPRELKLGRAGDAGTIEVLDGLGDGETVVLSGQFLLDSESRLKEALAKQAPTNKTGASPTTLPTLPGTAPGTAATTTAPTVDTDAIARAYLAIASTLGEKQSTGTRLDPRPLIDAIDKLAAPQTTTRLRAAVEAMVDQPISVQRDRFAALSAQVIEFVRSNPPASTVLHVAHCPMARDGAGADWLQADKKIANPYFATEMKTCGEIVSTIAPRK